MSYARATTRRPFRMVVGKNYLSDLIDGDQYPGGTVYLNANSAATDWLPAGNDANDGLSWSSALLTMSAALDLVKSGGRVLFVGDVREELTGSNLKFDVTIQGAGSLHHPDLPSAAYHPLSSMWRPPASPTATTPLLNLGGRGWNFVNIAFDCPVDSAAVYLNRAGGSGVSEYDPSHAYFKNCLFRQGLYGIQDVGGCHNVVVEDCEFFLFSPTGGTAIINTSSSIALPLKWTIKNCIFPADGAAGGNESHIDSPLTSSSIVGCLFGTVEGTGKYVDLTGGSGNMVFDNLLMGDYDTGDYVAGTGDSWVGNWIIAEFGGQTGYTTAAPTSAS